MSGLTLSQAIASGRLEDFISQAEREGVGAVSEADFAAAIAGLILTEPPPEGRTSRSPARGSSRGK